MTEQITITKRNGAKVPYSEQKILDAVNKALHSAKEIASTDQLSTVMDNIKVYDGISVEEIQEQVEKALMKVGLFETASKYIKYRANHEESRFIRERLDYMDKYANSDSNAATSSETDPNANVTQKNVANLEAEVYKSKNRDIQRQRMKDKLNEMFPEVAKQYEEDLNNHIIYCHDEASSPTLKQYTYSPKESVYAKIDNLKVLCSFETLYELSHAIPHEVEPGVYIKQPNNIFVKDKDGWTKVTCLTKKARHRDLYRVKTSFGEDLIVTDNHPMIVGNSKDETVNAVDSLGYTQFRTSDVPEFGDTKFIDLTDCVQVDYSSESFVMRHETQAPYYFAKRKVEITRELGYAIGFFIGDGNYDNTCHNLSYSQKDRKPLLRIADALFDSFGVCSSIVLNQNNKWILTVHSDIVYDVFRNFFRIKDKAWNKSLPYNLLEFPKEFSAGIIEGIIDSDGTVQDNSINIRLSSREAITQLTILLRAFGYGVANSVQNCPFGQNKAIKTNYTLWGVIFTNTPNSYTFSGSYKAKEPGETDKGLKYSTGNAKITNVSKIENCSYLELCDYIYDITTESNTLMCNNLWAHNCMAVSLYPLMLEGVGNIDGVTPSEPNDLQSFSGQITNLTFLLSSQCKGAVAFGEYFIALNYYIIMEFGPIWYEKLDCIISTGHCVQQRTIRDSIHKAFKQFLYGINQPAGNRAYQSPFTNISYYDKTYFQSLFGDFCYPDGSKPKWEAIDTLQRMFMKFFNKLRTKQILTFPVETLAMVHDGKDIVDKDYKELCAEMYAEGHSFFTYISDSADSLASCCRLRNEFSENTFSPTSGLTGVMTGSCNVITLNISRIVQNYFRFFPTDCNLNCYLSDKHDGFPFLKKYLSEILDRVYKYHIAFKTMLYEMEEKKMFAASNGGYIQIAKLYSTIGINGLNEAAEFLDMKVSNNEDYLKFLQVILGTIKEQNKLHSIKDKKRPMLFNSEVVPAEGLGGKNYRWDKEDGYWVPEDRNLYNSYFYNAHDNTSVLDKFILHGRQTYQYTDGGSAAHINLEDHLSKEQYLKLIDFAIEQGTNYFTFNVPNSKCEDCGHIVKHPVCECPKCGSKNVTWYTRVIGYLRPINAFGDDRQIEAKKRVYSKAESV